MHENNICQQIHQRSEQRRNQHTVVQTSETRRCQNSWLTQCASSAQCRLTKYQTVILMWLVGTRGPWALWVYGFWMCWRSAPIAAPGPFWYRRLATGLREICAPPFRRSTRCSVGGRPRRACHDHGVRVDGARAHKKAK